MARRVTILFDSGASHCFIHPRLLKDLNVKVDETQGPAVLRVADDRETPCYGAVENLQVLAGKYKKRMSMIAADIGTDDVIIGTNVLELAQAGFGPPGYFRMMEQGQEILIPLIGPDSPSEKIQTIRSTKKAVRLLRDHMQHALVGNIWRVEEAEQATNQTEQSADNLSSQSHDAEQGKKGQSAEGTSVESRDGGSQLTTSSQTSKQARRQRRQDDLERKIEQAKMDMKETSASMREQLLAEFPDVFSVPDQLAPLRWCNHEVQLEPGA